MFFVSWPVQSRLLFEVIAQHAPAAWAHINVVGEYDFSVEKSRDALGIFPLKHPLKQGDPNRNK